MRARNGRAGQLGASQPWRRGRWQHNVAGACSQHGDAGCINKCRQGMHWSRLGGPEQRNRPQGCRERARSFRVGWLRRRWLRRRWLRPRRRLLLLLLRGLLGRRRAAPAAPPAAAAIPPAAAECPRVGAKAAAIHAPAVHGSRRPHVSGHGTRGHRHGHAASWRRCHGRRSRVHHGRWPRVGACAQTGCKAQAMKRGSEMTFWGEGGRSRDFQFRHSGGAGRAGWVGGGPRMRASPRGPRLPRNPGPRSPPLPPGGPPAGPPS